jgi:hypothetical protein
MCAMPRKLEYDFRVQRLNRATAAGFASVLFTVVMLLTCAVNAQINGMPASVTSPGFGGHQVNGVAPSVTSLGRRGYTPAFPTCCFRGTTPARPNLPLNFHHHHHNGAFVPWGGGAVYPVPYYGYYASEDDSAETTPDDQYNGGPTVFDRRGPGTTPAPTPYSSEDRSESAPRESRSAPAPQPEPAPASDQPQTVLVFKDGHQVEVANYAIVGSTLYDLTGERRHKISLAELDLTATAKQNDDRGIDFQLPAGTEAN